MWKVINDIIAYKQKKINKVSSKITDKNGIKIPP